MSLFVAEPPSARELLKIRSFFPKGCAFYWDPYSGAILPEISLELYRKFDDPSDVCGECKQEDCPVRKAPYLD